MSNTWFRFYDDVINDPKVAPLPPPPIQVVGVPPMLGKQG